MVAYALPLVVIVGAFLLFMNMMARRGGGIGGIGSVGKSNNISTKPEPEIEKKGTPASPATALANRVLPVPGEPTSSAPLGSFAPMAVYLPGLCRTPPTGPRCWIKLCCAPAALTGALP